MPVPWSTQGPLTALVTLLTGLTGSGLQQIYTGVPASLSHKVDAYVTIGGQQIANKTTGGQMQRMLAYRVVFCYAVEGAEETAEETVAVLIDAFINAVFADRTLGATLEALEVDASEADRPQYAEMAGQMFREYPIRISGTQRAVYSV